MKQAIHVIGTTHTSEKSEKKILRIGRSVKPDCILREGVDDSDAYSFSNFIMEPIAMSCIFLWLNFMNFSQKDNRAVNIISKESSIPVHVIDRTLNDMVGYFHRWYNYFIFVILFSFSAFTFSLASPIVIAVIASFVISALIYFAYFVLRTKGMREEHWESRVKEIMRVCGYKKALLVCGREHSKEITGRLSKSGFIVNHTR